MNQFFYHIRIFLGQSSILVGGQAVMEGVMMRVPGAYATAVRNPNGEITVDRNEFISLIEKYPYLKKPLLRGIIGLFESMKIGFATLQWSAEISDPELKEKPPNKFADLLVTLFSICLALTLFFAAPIGITTWLFDKEQDAFVFNFIAGFLRVSFFLIYLILISFMKDVYRLFQYHGAEHKTVYNFESGEELSVKNAKNFSAQHPRCGTSFVFIIMLVTIFTYTILDSIALIFIDDLTYVYRMFFHVLCLPLVSGIGYEVLKFLAKHQKNIFCKSLSKPGMWLQTITTNNPKDDQLEIAIYALKTAFGEDLTKYKGKKFSADAIG